MPDTDTPRISQLHTNQRVTGEKRNHVFMNFLFSECYAQSDNLHLLSIAVLLLIMNIFQNINISGDLLLVFSKT